MSIFDTDIIPAAEMKEIIREEIVKKNLQMLRDINSEFVRLTNAESIGGNAGSFRIGEWTGGACAINVYLNFETGQIHSFSNHGLPDNVPASQLSKLSECFFKVGFMLKKGAIMAEAVDPASRKECCSPSYILQFGTYEIALQTPEAKKAISETVHTYNIGEAESFTQLYLALDLMEKDGQLIISGAQKEPLSVVEMKKKIERVRGGAPVECVTRNFGLRNKVSELLKNEK